MIGFVAAGIETSAALPMLLLAAGSEGTDVARGAGEFPGADVGCAVAGDDALLAGTSEVGTGPFAAAAAAS